MAYHIDPIGIVAMIRQQGFVVNERAIRDFYERGEFWAHRSLSEDKRSVLIDLSCNEGRHRYLVYFQQLLLYVFLPLQDC